MPLFHEIIHVSKDEDILGTFRSHPAVVLLSITPFACILILLSLFVFPLLSLGTYGVIALCILTALDLFFIATLLSQWIGTIVIITNRRIIKINRRSLITKFVNEYQLDTITEISYNSSGIVQALFSLGTISITALYTGTRYAIIACVSHPGRVLDIISHAIAGVIRKNEHAHGNLRTLHQVAVSGDDEEVLQKN